MDMMKTDKFIITLFFGGIAMTLIGFFSMRVFALTSIGIAIVVLIYLIGWLNKKIGAALGF